MDRRPILEDVAIADGLPLTRLYARFDAIARGRTQGDSAAAHQSIIERLKSNQVLADNLGWTALVLQRQGGSGRLELRGTPPNGPTGVLVPDAMLGPMARPTPG